MTIENRYTIIPAIMKLETERILAEALMRFNTLVDKNPRNFLDGLKGVESYWQEYLERMAPHLPQGLIQKAAELTSVEGLLEHSLLESPLAVDRLSLFEKLNLEPKDLWSYSDVLTVCGITQEYIDEERERRSGPGD